MSEEDDDRFSLSRRKALAGLAGIGGATALGGAATFAQLSDTESNSVTFTAGGLDGKITWDGSYNGEPVENSDLVSMEPSDMTAEDHLGNSVPIDVHFDDVKPGDFGCVNFGITVQSNAAWVASGLNVVENIDYKNYEPEINEDSNVSVANAGPEATESFDPSNLSSESLAQGELAQNIYALPYYDSDASCTFFDPSTDQFDPNNYDSSSPGAFWSNSQDGDELTKDDPYVDDDGEEYYLAPRTLLDISQNVNAVDTAHWSSGDGSLGFATVPGGSASVATGSVMLDGTALGSPDTGNNTQGVEPLQPGDTLNFGYDFHIPFSTGNVIQGDRASITLDFQFIQTRHTEAPDFTSYSPGSNT